MPSVINAEAKSFVPIIIHLQDKMKVWAGGNVMNQPKERSTLGIAQLVTIYSSLRNKLEGWKGSDSINRGH